MSPTLSGVCLSWHCLSPASSSLASGGGGYNFYSRKVTFVIVAGEKGLTQMHFNLSPSDKSFV
jgi:hypothetical protein